MADGSGIFDLDNRELQAFCNSGSGNEVVRRNNYGDSFLSSLSGTSCTVTQGTLANVLLSIFLTSSLVLLVIGSFFTARFLADDNFHAAIWAFFTASISLGTASIFLLHLSTRLDRWHDRGTLEGIKIFGMIMSITSGISMGVYFILGFLHRQNFELHGDNYFASAAFGGLTLASSLFLYFTAQWYQNALPRITDEAIPLPTLYSLASTSATVK